MHLNTAQHITENALSWLQWQNKIYKLKGSIEDSTAVTKTHTEVNMILKTSCINSLRTADLFPVVASLPPAGETKAEKTGCPRRLLDQWRIGKLSTGSRDLSLPRVALTFAVSFT